MKFGLFYELQLPKPYDRDTWDPDDERRIIKEMIEQVEFADRLGFDYVFQVEHHFLEEYSHSGAPEVVLPGQTGYLVPFGDTKTLADNIVTLLSDPKLREEMGARGRTVVDPAYRAETMVRDIADLYKALAERYRDRLAAFDSKGKVPATAAARTSR